MTNKWFAGNFCPAHATCSEENGALAPTNGPKIRTLVYSEEPNNTLVATVAQVNGQGIDPTQWIRCEGQLLVIRQNEELFSVIGTMYGGDGRVVFGAPDLRNTAGNFYICKRAIIKE